MSSKVLIIISFLSSVCILSQNHKKTNKIDSLQTVEDIQKFIEEKNIDYTITVSDKLQYSDQCKSTGDSLNFRPWIKEDFDQNGLTDLLLTGNTKDGPKTICILDMGNEFNTKKITRGSLYEPCAFVTTKEGKIEYKSEKILSRNGYFSNLQTDYLMYKFGEFIEENRNPKRHNILEIEFDASPCYGKCASFTLKILSNRDVEWLAKRDNHVNFHDYSGAYKAKISQEQYKELTEILNYIDFENLDENYSVGHTDSATGTLKVTYDNLKTKNISDYGMMGTRGLQKLYKILFDLRGSAEWKK
ncbi:MAG: DUF6438 domain-containing protein [Chryseobacterium jejuense]|uniref:DUF6438 domain-containing protein n=1 Tax=Chryseobacterium jejuense TaxID=445960 RepID=UPI003D14797B